MRLGLRAFIKYKLKAKSKHFAIGIAIHEDAVFFCLLDYNGSGQLSLELEKVASASTWPQQLALWVRENGLSGTSTYVAFSIDFYQQLQVDKPAVEDSEINQALQFSISELLGKTEPKAIEHFDMPVLLAGNKKLNVIAMSESTIQKAVHAVFEAGLSLVNVSVEELVTCNLLPNTQEPVLTLIQEGGNEVCLNIVKDGMLYFSRRLKGFENLSSFSPEELRMGIVDSLCVQIQRSMDYFESQLRQAPVRHIKFKLNTPHIEALKQQINQFIPAQVDVMTSGLETEESNQHLGQSFTALGAAMAATHKQQLEEMS